MGKPVSVSVGPFQQMVVHDSVVSGNRLPLVLISHGTGGSEGSHYDTALALAAEGFVVVALTHTGDNYRDQSYVGNRMNLTDGSRQVNVVLSYMLSTWTQHDRLDPARVGMFGFSLGGFTTLVEIGGIPETGRMRDLCTKRPTAPKISHRDVLNYAYSPRLLLFACSCASSDSASLHLRFGVSGICQLSSMTHLMPLRDCRGYSR